MPFRRSTASPSLGRVTDTPIVYAPTDATHAGEVRFRTMFEQAALGVTVLDAAGTILDANDAFHAFLGYPKGALIGMHAPALSPEEDASITRGPVAALRNGTSPSATVEKRFIRRDGAIRWASLTLTLLPLPSGEVGVLGMFLDITARREAEAALARRERRLRLIYNSASDLMFLMRVERDAAGAVAGYRCESVNEAHLAVTGLARDQIEGRAVEEVLPPGQAAAVRARYDVAVATGDVQRYDEELDLPMGHLVFETTLTPIVDDAGVCTHLLGAARDVGARRRAESALRESEARVRGAMEASLDALFVLRAVRDAAGGEVVDFEIVDCNARAAALWDAAPEGLFGRRMSALLPVAAEREGRMFEALRGVVATGKPHVHEYEVGDLRTQARWAKLQAVRLGDGLAVTARDITEQKQVEETLRGLALVDELTGVHNRRGFLAVGEREWQRAEREGRGAILVYIDLDDFKAINDAHGHAEGDRALGAVADVLHGVFRGGDVIGRLGGDEFAVLVTSTSAVLPTAAELHAVEARLRDRLMRHLVAANAEARAVGRPYDLAMSIGIASALPECSGAPTSLSALMVEADERLYDEKRARAGQVVPARAS